MDFELLFPIKIHLVDYNVKAHRLKLKLAEEDRVKAHYHSFFISFNRHRVLLSYHHNLHLKEI